MRSNVIRVIALALGLFIVCAWAIGGQAANAKNQGKGHSKQTKQNKTSDAVITATGKLVIASVNDDKEYALQDVSGEKLYYLEVGPRWFYKSSAHPLDKYADQQVTVVGVVEGPKQRKKPNPNANPHANANKPKQAKDAPTLEVFTINGETIRGAGKPPWAGGPKSVPDHPGSKGKGHGNGNKNGKKDKGTQNNP